MNLCWCSGMLIIVYLIIFFSRGFWDFWFRPMELSVLLTSTLPGILNIFVFEKYMYQNNKEMNI